MSDPDLVSDFDYELPSDRIAQEPAARRDHARLLVLDRAAGVPGLSHRRFDDLPSLLRSGDLLVVNDTRVLPARLVGRRAAPGTGGAVEALLVERLPGAGPPRWRALMKGGGWREGEPLDFGGGLLARLIERDAEGAVLELSAIDGQTAVGDASIGEAGIDAALERAGRMPTPPYIRRPAPHGATADEGGGVPRDPRESVDRERYQTIFAREPGALAAPTAGLHFTPDLIAAIRSAGVEVDSLTLHVGLGTFQPVRVERVADHRMHPERFDLPASLAAAVSRARRRGGRVVAVGTTVTRVLEWRAAGDGMVEPGSGRCDLFIRPGHRFRVVDALITNFHLPCSTLLMLVSAFAGRETVLAAYRAAIEARYRFYSYGDAMLLY